MLTRALKLHSTADKEKDRDWLHLVLEFLRACVEDLGKELIIDDVNREEYFEKLLASLKDAAGQLQAGISSVCTS